MNSPKLNRLTDQLFYLALLLFIIGFNFTDNPVGNWYQQFMPNLNGQPISDIFFIDSLTGWAVTRTNTSSDSGYILKTTNGGDNWTIKFKNRNNFRRIKFLNNLTGFTCGFDYVIANAFLYKSTNGGENWFALNVPSLPDCRDMAVLNEDTIWIVNDNSFIGGCFRTTNGGSTWTAQPGFAVSANPNKIYMYNRNIGFACDEFRIYKTTNSGMNWIQITGVAVGNSFFDIYFADSLTGWKSDGYMSYNDTNMRKTTDGGLNWVRQQLPRGGIISNSGMQGFVNINRDTIWGGGGNVLYPNNQPRGILYRTTNGGLTWYFQIPDTSINIVGYPFCEFVDKYNGWGYLNIPATGIHTTTGGDTIFYLPIKQISSKIPKQFYLFQNYPNPFNISSKFKIQISKLSYVKVIVYDITGKVVTSLVNGSLKPGEYEIHFDGSNYSSGVYFYSLIADGKLIDTKKMILLK